MSGVSGWYSIEVLNTSSSALAWFEGYRDVLSGVAVSHGASDWDWVGHPWGYVFEVEFADESVWEAFRSHPAVAAALDAVPDPVNGLLVHPGRGGSSGTRYPRRPLPRVGSGAAAIPLPVEEVVTEAVEQMRLTALREPARSS